MNPHDISQEWTRSREPSEHGNTVKLGNWKVGKQTISILVVAVLLVNLILTNPSSQNHVVLNQANVSNMRINASQISGHANLSIWAVHPIEPWALPLAHSILAFVDREPVKVDWSLTCSNTNLSTEQATKGFKWEPNQTSLPRNWPLSWLNPKRSQNPKISKSKYYTGQIVTRELPYNLENTTEKGRSRNNVIHNKEAKTQHIVKTSQQNRPGRFLCTNMPRKAV
jgi:hypothetical protein